MATANERALDEGIKDAVTLERMKAREVRDVIAFMRKDFAPDYIEGLNNSLARIEGLPRDQQLRQLAGMMNFLNKLAAQKTDLLFNDVILENAKQTGLISMTQQVDALNQAIPDEVLDLGFVVRGVNEATINETIRNTLINGSTIQETVTNFVADFDGKVTQQLRMGINNGETISELTQRVRGVINKKGVNAQTIARTVQTAVSAEVRETTFYENSDVVKAYEWVSTLDTRTSDICKSLDGEIYNLDDPKRRKPPAHPNCRSTIVPVLKSWKELGIDAPELSAGTRRDMDGKSISAKTDYGEWLKGQSENVQNEALGEDKAKLFRDNNLDMKDFVNRIGEPLTAEQVKANLDKRRRRGGGVTETKPKKRTPVRSKADRLKEKLEEQKKKTADAKKKLEATQKIVSDKKAELKKIEDETAKLKKKKPVKKSPPKKKVKTSAEITKDFQKMKMSTDPQKRSDEAFSMLIGQDINKKKPNFDFKSTSLTGERRTSASGTAKGLKISKDLQKNVDKVLSDYSKVLPAGSIDENIGLFQNRSKRAFYAEKNKFTGSGAYLGLHSSASVDAIYHEVAHHIEDTKDGLQLKAQEFIKRRTKNSPKESLSKYGMKGEYGNADNFIKAIKAVRPNESDWVNNASALYMGKTYKGGSTEAISMGMELFIEDAQAFAEADPDYFEFIVDALR